MKPRAIGNVGDVHCPDLVGPGDGQISQQIGVNLVTRHRAHSIRLAIQRFDTHPFHQRRDVQPARLDPFLRQQVPQHPSARKWKFRVQLVDLVHQLQIGVRDRARLAMDAAPADPQHAGLAADAEL
jgi:hypothetical protein